MSARPPGLEDVREAYTRWAPWYEATHGPIPGRARARRALALRGGDHVLDLACGTGLNLAGLRHAVGPSGVVVGADVTPAMLARAEARIRRHGWSNVRVVETDAARLPFEDLEFDGVLCTFALGIIPELGRALDEVARVLRPRGTFVALELATDRPGLLRRCAHRFPHAGQACRVRLDRDLVGAVRARFAKVDVRAAGAGVLTLMTARGPRARAFAARSTEVTP